MPDETAAWAGANTGSMCGGIRSRFLSWSKPLSGRFRLLLVWALTPVVLCPSSVKADEQAAARAAEIQRQQQIDQQAKQMEQFFLPSLQGELERVRRTCGSLAPEARKAIVAAGSEGVKASAKQFAAGQLGERGNKKFDARQTIHEAVAAAVKPHATPDEFVAFEREHAARLARREQAARTQIVAKLDRQLELSIAQREVITAELEKQWEAGWIRELDDNGSVRVGNDPLAPDFAEACVAPHLDERQRAEWKRWSEQAGWSRMNLIFGWNFDGQTLQADPWWKP